MPKSRSKNSSRGEVIRAYKVGLRVPESLLTDFTTDMRRTQVLLFLIKRHTNTFSVKQRTRCTMLSDPFPNSATRAFEEFKEYATLQKAPSALLVQYQALLTQYFSYPLTKLQTLVKQVQRDLEGFKTQDPRLRNDIFMNGDIPRFRDPARPLPSEISLHDYQHLANRSLKLICTYLNQFAVSHIDQLPETREELLQLATNKSRIAPHQLQKHPYKAASVVLGAGRNMDQMALAQMTTMMEVFRDMQAKVRYTKARLYPAGDGSTADLSDAVPYLLTYYSLPRYFLNYLAKAWDADLGWVRNTLVGWRRKLDSHLSLKFQVESLIELMEHLAEFCRKHARSVEGRKVIGLLQKAHLLHLWHNPHIDFRPLLPSPLHPTYLQLRRNIPAYPRALRHEVERHITRIGQEPFTAAGQILQTQVQTVLEGLLPGTVIYQRVQTFLNKVKFLLTNLQLVLPKLTTCVPGNRFTRAIAQLLASTDPAKRRRFKRLFTPLRGILALAFAQTHASPNPRQDATAQFQSAFTPANCVTRPYQGKTRRKKHLPLNLLFNKYVVERQAAPDQLKEVNGKQVKAYLNNTDATALLQSRQPIWLGIPIYAPAQLSETPPLSRKRVIFWFQLVPSSKIQECLAKGARLKDLRLNVPKGPTNKVVVDVILEAETRTAFQHRGNFLAAWNCVMGDLVVPQGTYLGSDFNRLGPHTLKLATTQQELPLTPLLEPFAKAAIRLEKIRKQEIPHIQRKLASGKGSPKRRGRWKAQVTLLHERRKRVLQELRDRGALMLYLYGLYRTGATHAAWDAVQGISPRGTKGALAEAVTTMPKKKSLHTLFTEWAGDLEMQGILPNYRETGLIQPLSREFCAKCFAEGCGLHQTRQKGIPWDDFICTDPTCGHHGCSHANNARLAALLLQNIIESSPVASIDGIG